MSVESDVLEIKRQLAAVLAVVRHLTADTGAVLDIVTTTDAAITTQETTLNALIDLLTEQSLQLTAAIEASNLELARIRLLLSIGVSAATDTDVTDVGGEDS